MPGCISCIRYRLEKKCGKVGILCTEGFRDVFLFREGPNKNPFDMFLDYPEPFVPRYLTLPVKERINSEGGVDVELSEEDVRKQTRKLKEYNVEAICICFLWSTVNPEHEKKAAEIVHDEWPEVTVVLSSEVNPSNREYRRWVSAAMDASLRKLISTYANDLNTRLNEKGFIGKVGMVNSAGGVMSTNEIVERPLYSLDSGPSMAPVSGRRFAMDDLDEKNAVVLDMGGTTFDVSCVTNGHISVSKEAIIGNEIPGISRVNVHSIGAGGGACGLHAIALAEGLEMDKLLIPRTAGGLSAVGGILSDIVSEYNGSLYTRTNDFNFEGVNNLLKELKDKAKQFFKRNKISEDRQKIEVFMEAHYPFQVYELAIDITQYLNDDLEVTPESIKGMEEAFHEEHERTFSIKDDTYLECITWRVKAIGKHEREAQLPAQDKPPVDLAYEPAKNTGTRKVFFKQFDDIKITPVFHGADLGYGDTVHGPAIIEEPTTTIVILPGYHAKITKYNNYCIEKEKKSKSKS